MNFNNFYNIRTTLLNFMNTYDDLCRLKMQFYADSYFENTESFKN